MIQLDGRSRWFIKPFINGYSLMGIINLLWVQWFFVRIEATVSDSCECFSIGLMGFVLPWSGWWNRYIKLGQTWRI